MGKKQSDKEMKPQAELDALLADAENYRQHKIAAFKEPRFTLGEITSKLNISPMTVRNWLTRCQLDLSANEGRAESP